MNKKELQIVANEVRKGIIVGVYNAKSGHPGGSLSATECLVYLYFKELNVDPQNPDMENRDRFVLSKGHAAPGLYATLAAKGYFPMKEMENLRHIGSMLQGHPTIGVPGVDMSTGSLGQGVSAAVGMALGARVDGKSYRTYALLGDGELEEGQVWEAAMLAGNRKLDNLCLIVDNNNLQIDGTLEEVNSPYPIGKKFAAFGFNVIEVADGNDFDQLDAAFGEARNTKGMPSVIVMKTLKGKGVSYMENAVGWHGQAPKADLYKVAMDELTKAGDELCQK
ncbi:MAG: transketolase [Lachnospiraceae bacterium]|nr:transketolase [Lachnospiraceae bacterium]